MKIHNRLCGVELEIVADLPTCPNKDVEKLFYIVDVGRKKAELTLMKSVVIFHHL